MQYLANPRKAAVGAGFALGRTAPRCSWALSEEGAQGERAKLKLRARGHRLWGRKMWHDVQVGRGCVFETRHDI